MKKAVLFLLLWSGTAFGQSVTLPPEVPGEPGEFVQIKATTKDMAVKWLSLDKGLNLFPTELLKDSKTAVVSSVKPGRYRVLAVSAKDDVPSDFAVTTVVIGGVVPPVDPPIPVPIGKAKSLTFVVFAPTQKTAAVTEDADFRAYLKANGVGIYAMTTQAQRDANPKFVGITSPSIVLQDQSANVIASIILTDIIDLAAAKAFVAPFVGK